jgi:Protein of unknown function (DUF3455)
MRSFIRTIFFSALCLTFASAAQAQAQDATQPPSSEQPVLTLHATGSQTYSCQRADAAFHWVFLAPAARLFDDAHNEVATHGDGPVWNYQDGSSVGGVMQASSPSPEAGSIPWLLLKAVNPQRTGILTKVDLIRRSDTHGGAAPATGCDADHQGDFVRVPYTATYTFYGRP